jgi:D-alanyl-D-alanine carboxypeptidase
MVAAMKHEMSLLEQVERLLEETGAPGACVALRVDGKLVLDTAVGFRDLEQSDPLVPIDRFYIYSTIKTVIAALVMQLVEAGQVALDGSLQSYLPGPLEQFRLPVMTLRQLLNHTSGLPDYGGMKAYYDAVRAAPGQPWSGEQYLQQTLAQGMRFAPGEGFAYSNIGYLLLRMLIEVQLDAPFSTVLQERIFTPLGLERSQAARSLEQAAPILTAGYTSFFSGGALEDMHSTYHPGWVSHGVVISTAGELAHMFSALLAGPLLLPSSRDAMLQAVPVPVQHPLFRSPGYGLGLMVDTASPWGVMAGHGGGGPGYAAGVLHLPDAHITAAALVNCDRGDLGLKLAYALCQYGMGNGG